MRVVMTLLARNEADIVDAQLAFHLHAGVDFVVATDNGSDDGTTEILERYARAGVLHLIHEPGNVMRQQEWVTRMARLAATDFGADWVINSDADEFWWPRGGSLKEVLALVPERFGVIRGCWRHFVPRLPDDGFFAERMTARLTTPAHPGDKQTIYHAHSKVAHRASSRVVVAAGNHDAVVPGELAPLRFWHPIEVLHFSIRSAGQLRSKGGGGWVRNRDEPLVEYQLRLAAAARAGQVDDMYRALAVDDDGLAAGLADGTLALDMRARDALRAIRMLDGSFRLPGPKPLVTFPRPPAVTDSAYAAEVSVLVGIDGIVRAEERVAKLEARLAAVRTLPRR